MCEMWCSLIEFKVDCSALAVERALLSAILVFQWAVTMQAHRDTHTLKANVRHTVLPSCLIKPYLTSVLADENAFMWD